MNYNIKGTNLEVTEELRAYVEKRLAHPDKFLSGDTTAHADVELEYATAREGGTYRAEFTIEASGTVYRAAEWAGALHEAVDLAIEEVTKELRRSKRKRLDVFRHTAVRVKEYLRGWRSDV